MNGGWDIVGYRPYGGRQSLSHGLKASQFRSMGRSHIFQSPTYIQNNYYGGGHIWDCHAADPYCCGGGGGGMSKFTQWMMGIGMTLPLVGNILEMFMPKKAEGAGGSDDGKAKTTPEDPTLKGYQEAYKEKCTIVKISDNKYIITPKDGLPQEVSELNVDTINGVLGKKPATPAEEEPGTEGAGGTGKGTGTGKAEDEAAVSTKPNLFEKMDAFKDTAEVLAGFNTATGGTDAYSIEDAIASGNGIQLKAVKDHGNGTEKTLNLSISSENLTKLKNGETVSLGNGPNGYPVTAENFDGYIKVTAGPDRQTYIIGKDGNAHQYSLDGNDGNVTGYNKINWSSRVAPPPTDKPNEPVKPSDTTGTEDADATPKSSGDTTPTAKHKLQKRTARSMTYTSGNKIQKDGGVQMFDADALFTINGGNYKLDYVRNGKTGNYHQADYGDLTSGNDRLINDDGSFNVAYLKKYPNCRFSGNGPLNGKQLVIGKLNGKEVVCILGNDGKKYVLDSIMNGAKLPAGA